jgi:septal ring factor EnvC (AmiA/AmiB activator)
MAPGGARRLIRWRCRARAGVLLALTMAWSGTGDAAADGPRREQLDLLRVRIADLQQRMRSTEGEQHSLTAQLQAAEQAIGRVAGRLRVLSAQLVRQQERLDELRQAERRQQQALASERLALAQQIRAAYAMGRQERLKILLNQQDPARVSRLLTYYDYLNRARARRMAEIERRLAALRSTQQEIARETERFRTLEQSELAEQVFLQQQQAERQRVLIALTEDLRQQGSELERLQRDERRLQRLLADIEQVLADIPEQSPADERFDRLRGRLPWPARGVIAAEFGAAKAGGLSWDGVMIGAPEGREVRAIHHGRVAFADWLRGFGLLLIVDHGDGWMTLYGHNQSLFKEAGDWVEANEPVALTGASGGREEPGVYFGIRHQGRPVDPLRWCLRPKGRNVG